MNSRAHTLIAISCVLAFLVVASSVSAAPPAHHWSKRAGSALPEYGESVATDPAGNIVVTGAIHGNTSFGGYMLVPQGVSDPFVVKYDSAGNHIWSQAIGDSTEEKGFGIATDAAGNVYVTGSFYGTTRIAGWFVESAGETDIFVAKFSPSGFLQWNRGFGGSSYDQVESIAVDGEGNIFVTGSISGSVDFGGSPVGSGDQDAFLLKLDQNGSHVASAAYGATGFQHGMSVATDSTGNVVLAGIFQTSIDFGGGPLVSAGSIDAFVVKFDNNLNYAWSRRAGSTDQDYGNSVAITPTGEVYLCGSFQYAVDFGGGALTSAGHYDVFLAKYAANGAHIWSKRFGSEHFDAGYGVTVNNAGQPFIGGLIQGPIDFGGGTSGIAATNSFYVAHFDALGNHLWSASYLGSGSVSSVVADPAGDVIVTGAFQGSMDAGGGVLTSAGSSDVFVAKYGGTVPQPRIMSITDIANDQGRKVKIRFDRSGWDGPVTMPVTQYEAYRRDDAAPSVSSSVLATSSRDELLNAGWTQVGAVGAHGESAYGIDVPTIGDSTITTGQYRSVFYIRAATDLPTLFFDSEPDSGYSLDNLAPGVPQNLVFNAGDIAWDDSAEEDFDFFTVYGSNVDAFGSATVVDFTATSAMDVGGSPYAYYYVTATDFSGNEGKPARVNTLSTAGGTPKSYVLSVSNYPNPFNPSTTVSYTLPTKGHVTLTIFDARGSRVTTLVNTERTAGAYTVDWQAGASVSSGVYFARIEHNGTTRTKKIVLLK